MTAEATHTCASPKSTCSSCRGCAGKRAAHVVRLSSGDAVTVVRCGHCDGPQAHAIPAHGQRLPVRHCLGKLSGLVDHEPHLIGKAAA